MTPLHELLDYSSHQNSLPSSFFHWIPRVREMPQKRSGLPAAIIMLDFCMFAFHSCHFSFSGIWEGRKLLHSTSTFPPECSISETEVLWSLHASQIFSGCFLSLLLAVVPVNKYRNVFLRFIRPFCSQVVCLSLPRLNLMPLYRR